MFIYEWCPMHSLSELASSVNGRSVTILRLNNKKSKSVWGRKREIDIFFIALSTLVTARELNTYPNLFNFHSKFTCIPTQSNTHYNYRVKNNRKYYNVLHPLLHTYNTFTFLPPPQPLHPPWPIILSLPYLDTFCEGCELVLSVYVCVRERPRQIKKRNGTTTGKYRSQGNKLNKSQYLVVIV